MTACWLCVDGSARKSGGIEYGLNSILTEKWEGKAYRLVIQRQRRVDGNLDLWEGEYTYRCILTNGYTSTNREVVEFYNLRGGKERIFDDMNNGFGWARLPKSFMSENTVFLLLTALIRNFYKFLMDRINAKSLRTKEDRATAQALHIIPHLHRHLHLSSPRALFPNKNQIQAVSVSAMLVDTLTGQKQAKVSPLKKMATTNKRIIRNIVIFLAQIKEKIIIHYVIKSIWFELSTKIQ